MQSLYPGSAPHPTAKKKYAYEEPDPDSPDYIRDLEVGPDGRVWSATEIGVRSWNDADRSWELVRAGSVRDLAVDGDVVYALSWQNVIRIEGGDLSTIG